MFSLLQMKQNKQSAPYWRVSLLNLCRMVNGLRQESWSSEEEEDSELREGSLQLLEELYNLQHICRVLQSREERVRHTHTNTVVAIQRSPIPLWPKAVFCQIYDMYICIYLN